MPALALKNTKHGAEGQIDSALQPEYAVGQAFCGLDAHAFIMPTFKQPGVFRDATKLLIELSSAVEKGVSGASPLLLDRKEIFNLAGVSWGTHRDKIPVRTLGRTNPRWFIGSQRTIAGTLVFWMGAMSSLTSLLTPQYQAKLLYPDEIPYFDLFLSFLNDSGDWSSAVIQGITILDDSHVVEQSNPEGITETYSYQALGCTPVMPGYFSVLPEFLREKIVAPQAVYSGSGSVKRN